MPDGAPGTPDEYFARTLSRAGNVILGAESGAIPHALFRTNAWALGDIAARRDADGILRRVRAFEDYLIWHPMILEAARKFDGFTFDTNGLSFTLPDRTKAVIPMEAEALFDAGKLLELGTGQRPPPGPRRTARAFTRQRVWDLGLALAARSLQLDLDHPVLDPGRIVLHGSNGVERVIPIDARNRLCIDWSFPLNSPQLTREAFHSLLHNHRARARGETNTIRELWRGKLAVVGSIASGNDLTDFGATPLEKETFLTTRSWNVANSLLTGRFVRQLSLPAELLLILFLGALAGLIAWRLRALVAALITFLVAALYVAVACQTYFHSRLWLPMVMPAAALLLTHFVLITYRAVFEQSERRRIRNVFARIVSPNVVHELLKAETLSLGGARRAVTVFFADVRGFTELTDESHARAAAEVAAQQLAGAAAEARLDSHAAELLSTINLYLGAIADVVKQRDGTLDKYIGDCVMAFWGAPTPNEKHAVACVRAAIDAQRAVYALNQQRAAENAGREQENVRLAAAGQPALPLLKLLSMGVGVNTGIVTVGLMGSEQHTFNYTILGRDVNLAQRLEASSGRARIFIGEATYQDLLRDDPTLAATCIPAAPAQFKGFREAVKHYEVPWKEAPAVAA
jgi:class 3 adenylate cyclase